MQEGRHAGGFEEVRSNPPFCLQKDFKPHLTVHFKVPYCLQLENGVIKYCNVIGQCMDSKSHRILSGYLY